MDNKIFLSDKIFFDANFRKALTEILGISEGDEITEEMIAATTEFNVANKNISDLTGIEHFTALTKLNCYYNQLTELDVSKNTALTVLDCYCNQLASLDVSKNTALSVLSCSRNPLTSLDVSKNTALEYLYCHRNRLMELDVTENHQLIRLYVGNNVEVYSSPNLNKKLLIIRET